MSSSRPHTESDPQAPHAPEVSAPRRLRDHLPAPVRKPLGRLRRTLGRFVPDAVWYNWRWDMVAGICTGVYQGAIWTFALQLARGKLHVSNFQMALATAAPAVGFLFAMFWARQMEGRSKLPFVTITWLLSRGLFVLTPLLVRGAVGRDMFVLLICLTPIIFSVSVPAYTVIMKDIYPDALRGRLMSYVRAGMALSMLITARVAGYWQEHGIFGVSLNYRWMFALGGLFGIATAVSFRQLRLPPALETTTLPPMRAFLRDTFRILGTNKGYRWFTTSVFVSGFGNLVASTYYPIYQVDKFHITPTQIATMQNIAGVLSLASLFFWGWYMDRYGSLASVLVAVFVICLTPLIYSASQTVTWLYAAAAVNSIAQYGIDLGYLNTTLLFAEPGRAAQYQSVHSSFFGLRGTIAPLIAVRILASVGHNWRYAFSLCVSIMFLGALCQLLSLRSYRRAQASSTPEPA